MATEQSASELKQQGALEAARDPDAAVSSDDAQHQIVEESRKQGLAAFTFDPNATVQQKKALARDALPEGLPHRRKGIALVTDIDDGSRPDVDLPSPSKEGAVAVVKDEDGNTVANGSGPLTDEAEYGDKTGWAPRFGWPHESSLESASLLDHTTWLESQLPDHLFGDWYHNAAIIAFACISTWLAAILGAGIGWIFIVTAICSTYYRTSIRRARRNFRDDITREMCLKKLDTDNESVEWMNSFMLKFWPIYQPVLAQTIINSVDQVLSASTPAFLDSLKLKTFTLGSKPPRIDHVKTYPKTEDDIVLMDWKFSFTPNDTADMTAKQIKNKINPKIVLEIRVGKAMISKGLDVILEDMAFSGNMRIKMKLQIPFPHIEKVEICFLERPMLDYVCKPLGGDTFGFDINFIPGLETFIQEQIHATLAPMMYAPNVFPIEVAKMLAGTPVDQAVGVVAITLHGAQGLKNPDNFSGTPDPYAVVSLNRRQPLAQTKVIKESANPRWNETHYVIVTSLNESLDIQIYDYNEFRKDKELGAASFQLENLEDAFEHENERLELIHDGKARGVLFCDIRFFPVLEAKKLPDGTDEFVPESNTGILRFTVEQAKDLDGTKSLVGLLNPYAQLLLNGKGIHATKKLKRTNNPIWDNGSKEILITDRKTAKLGVAIKDDRDIAGDQVIGTYQIKLEDILDLMAKGQEWYNLTGAKSGRVKMMAQWKPVVISGVAVGTGGYMTPIGVMRLHFKSAKELRNFEALGKSDPYTRVLLSGIERARTVTFKNNLNPEWDEVLYVPVHSPRERLQLEVMDAENMGRDRSLGLVEVLSGDYMAQDENGEWLVHDKKTARQDGLKLHGKGIPKGVLNYTVAFYPCLNVADPEDEEDEGEKSRNLLTPEPQAKGSAEIPRSPDAGRFSTSLGRGVDGGDRDSGKEPSSPLEPPKTPLTPTTPLSPVSRKSHEKAPPKIHLTPEELLKYESGLVIVKLIEADFPRSQLRVEFFVDDMAFPSYVSSKAKSKGHKFDEIGDCFIRELEFSKLTIKISERNEKQDDGGKNHVLARLTGNTLDTLKQCLNNPTTLKMKDDHGSMYSVKISLKYVPVKMHLDPSESINNMGNLRVDVLDAHDLPSADSNGKSDPYAKFELNGVEVFKTKTQKKTLTPVWNEFFEVPVPSRTAAKFKATVWDWDFADKPDFLGAAEISLDQLDPFKAQEMTLMLDGKSGTLRVRLVFRPDYVTRTRQGTSTFTGTFGAPTRIVTNVAGVPMRGTAAVAHGVGKGASFIKRGFRGKSKDEFEDGMVPASDIPIITTNGADPAPGMGLKRSTGLSTIGEPDATPPSPPSSIPPGPAISVNGGVTRNHTRTKSVGAKSIGGSSVRSAMMPGAASGVATFNVVSASCFPQATDLVVSIVQLRDGKTKTVGKTKHRKTSSSGAVAFDETFRCSCSPDNQFRVEVKEHHTFGSDAPLGDALFFVDESGSGQAKEVRIGTSGSGGGGEDGIVAIRSSFEPAADASQPSSSGGSGGHLNAEASPRPSTAHGGGSMRRSFLGSKRENRGSRETTPV